MVGLGDEGEGRLKRENVAVDAVTLRLDFLETLGHEGGNLLGLGRGVHHRDPEDAT